MLTRGGCGLSILPEEARISAPVTLPALPLTHPLTWALWLPFRLLSELQNAGAAWDDVRLS